jgi:hypothetical protein
MNRTHQPPASVTVGVHNLLQPRPMKLDPDFLARLVLRTALPCLVAFFLAAQVIWHPALREALGILAVAAAALGIGAIRARPLLLYRAYAREGEEVEAEVVGAFDGTEHGLRLGRTTSRGFRLRIENLRLVYEAGKPDAWPLFLDAAQTRALVLRHGRQLLVVRNDFHPFDFTPDEEQAIRARIEERRQLPRC